MNRDYYTKRFGIQQSNLFGLSSKQITTAVSKGLGDISGLRHGVDVTVKSATELYVSGGSIEIDGTLYLVEAQQTITLPAITIGVMYYIYMSPTAFEVSTTVPVFDHARGAEYKTGDTTKRYIARYYEV